ncbi:gp6 baseplate wedge subunit [Delftia phage PhiW-14]|uniref:Gp6 baseplate wedge subunit n=1 Tax=Delftia phage PhiW-14 TaxID=665032 RepID=C9DG36_BPW14|nr:gp6 baseplate wedge subunit [Delftia phage PhiW-14]ACV50087.1 gp6 baseplate wedge subunit [Delftia phage PhiW-14]
MTINRMTQSFEFNDIMESLKTYMSTQAGFRDVNWDGSVAKAILRVLAYNSQMQQAGNNFLFNEMDLQSATIPRNVNAISSVLGYVPRGKRAARYHADIVVRPVTGATTTPTLVLDRKAKFFTNKDGVSLFFSASTEHEAELIDGAYTFKNVELVQGRWVNHSYVVQADHTTEAYTIPFDSVDTDFVKVGVLPNNKSTDLTNYKKFENIYDLGKDQCVFFLDSDKNGRYSIEFGDDKISRRPAFGSVVVIEALTTEGADGNGAKAVESVSSVGGHYGVSVFPIQMYSYGGSDEDAIDTVRRIAPLAFSAQGNAVTTNDFVALTLANFPEAESAISWGGEENDPPMYGYQFVAVKPKSGDLLDDVQKAELKGMLTSRCVSSVTPMIVDPIFTHINIRGQVLYSHNSTVLSEQSMKIKVTRAIQQWSKEHLEFFGSDFVYSNLVGFVNGVDQSIRGLTLYVDYVKMMAPAIGAANNYTFSFTSPIKPGSVRITQFSTPSPVDIAGWAQDIFDKDGLLYLRWRNRDKEAGGERISPAPAGTVDYAKGTIQLVKFLALSTDTAEGVHVAITPDSQDPSLFGSKRSILSITNVDLEVRSRELIYEN